jgi:hypothetical protein
VRLAGDQLVLDANVLVHLLRQGAAGGLIEQAYAVGARRPRSIVPVVVKGEIKSLAYQFGWGTRSNHNSTRFSLSFRRRMYQPLS